MTPRETDGRPRTGGRPSGRPRRRPRGERLLRDTVVAGVLAFIGLLLLLPIGMAVVGSLHLWNPLNGTYEFIGLDNYDRMLHDRTLWRSAGNTLLFGAVAVTGRVVLGLALALALHSRLTRWRSFFRALFYMPTVTPLIAVAYVWDLMYDPRIGVVNNILGTDVNWLMDPRFALGSVLALTIWKDFGYAVILFLAGLHSIPEEVLEAAAVDGAGSWTRLRLIVVPLLRPMTLFIVVTSTFAYLQAFLQVLVLTEGGPGTVTQLLSFTIYEEAFVDYRFGYASAVSVVLLVFTALLTWVNFRVTIERAPRRRGRSA